MIFILKHAIVIVEGSSRLGVLSRGPPLLLLDMLLMTRQEGVWELDVPFVVHPFRWFFCLLGRGSFRFVPCIPPFFGCFDLFMIDRVSSF